MGKQTVRLLRSIIESEEGIQFMSVYDRVRRALPLAFISLLDTMTGTRLSRLRQKLLVAAGVSCSPTARVSSGSQFHFNNVALPSSGGGERRAGVVMPG